MTTNETATDGLHAKFYVARTDGRDKPGGDKADARYFVLDFVHDEHARAALKAYASACERDLPQLAADLRRQLAETVVAPPNPAGKTAEQVAQLFHETYESLAPKFGYRTREASAKPWADVPEQNRALMIATCARVLVALNGGPDGPPSPHKPPARAFLGEPSCGKSDCPCDGTR